MRRALLLALLAAGCRAPLTEIVVEVESDLAVPAELDTIHFEVDARGIGGRMQETDFALTDGPSQLPLRFGLVHGGGPLGPFDVRVGGGHGGRSIVVRTARTWFAEGRSVVLPIFLARACRDRPAPCPAGQTCVAGGRCESEIVDPLPRDDDAGSERSPDARAEPELDAGTRPDAGWRDPSCPPQCSCAPRSCDDGADCACRSGCECTLTCPAGGDCDAIECSGEGVRCDVGAEGASNVRVTCDRGATCRIDADEASNAEKLRCDHGASCEVSCHGASNCVLECRGGSRCLLDCGGASNCRMADCRLRIDCGSAVFACNRGCP